MAWDDPDENQADDEIDPEDPDESDMDDPDDPETIDCPWCGKSIHEQSEWCHHCGKYLSVQDAPRQVPRWIMVGTLMGLVAMLGFMLIWLVNQIVGH